MRVRVTKEERHAQVLNALSKAGEPQTVEQIAEAIGMKESATGGYLRALVKSGSVAVDLGRPRLYELRVKPAPVDVLDDAQVAEINAIVDDILAPPADAAGVDEAAQGGDAMILPDSVAAPASSAWPTGPLLDEDEDPDVCECQRDGCVQCTGEGLRNPWVARNLAPDDEGSVTTAAGTVRMLGDLREIRTILGLGDDIGLGELPGRLRRRLDDLEQAQHARTAVTVERGATRITNDGLALREELGLGAGASTVDAIEAIDQLKAKALAADPDTALDIKTLCTALEVSDLRAAVAKVGQMQRAAADVALERDLLRDRLAHMAIDHREAVEALVADHQALAGHYARRAATRATTRIAVAG